jgi:hypothetical protein
MVIGAFCPIHHSPRLTFYKSVTIPYPRKVVERAPYPRKVW